MFVVDISFRNEYNIKEKWFIALNAQKGIAVAVVIFSLLTLNIKGIKPILDLAIIFILYSIIISTIVGKTLGKKLEI